MSNSNIGKIFNPPSTQGEPVDQNDCVPCMLVSSAVMLLGGTYMATGAVFKESKDKPLPKAATPLWRNSVRGVGGIVALFGLARGMEAFMTASKENNEEKKL